MDQQQQLLPAAEETGTKEQSEQRLLFFHQS